MRAGNAGSHSDFHPARARQEFWLTRTRTCVRSGGVMLGVLVACLAVAGVAIHDAAARHPVRAAPKRRMVYRVQHVPVSNQAQEES